MTKKTNILESDSFVKKVKSPREKPLQPTHKKFSTSEWQDIFWSLRKPTITDYELFQSGIWFKEYFKNIRQKFKNIIFSYEETKDNLIRLQVGRINNFVENELTMHFQQIAKKSKLLQSSINGELVSNLETVIETLCFSLIEINQMSNADRNCHNNLKDWLNKTLDLSITYIEFQHFWMQCLWHNWYVYDHNRTTKVIRPQNPDKFLKHYISLSWNDEMLESQLRLAIKDWKDLIDTEKHKLLVEPILEVEHISQDSNLKFRISNRYQTPAIIPLEIVILFIKIKRIHYKELLEKPCPNFDNLTLLKLLSCWRFISPIVSQIKIKKHLSNNLSEKERLLRYSPTFFKEDLVILIMEAFNFTREQAFTIVDLFTYRGDYKDDIWCQPLIKVDDDRLTIVNASLKTPNLLRCLDSWIYKSGLGKGETDKEKEGWINDKLGKYFEKFVRQRLEKCNKLNNVKVYQESINFSKYLKEEKQKESDLIISIGNKIVLGEMKHRKYPTEPIEYGYYYQSLEKAANQLKDRKEFVENNLPLILEKLQLTHLTIEQIQVIPVIISSLPLATGQKFQNIPVVDIHILEWYLSQNKITWSTYSQNEQEVIQEIKLYSSEQEAEDNIENYLNNPPQLKIFLDNIKWKGIPIYNKLPKNNSNHQIYCYKPNLENIKFYD